MYGYEVIETLSERSNNYEMKVGTLYPLLHSLVQAGDVKSYCSKNNYRNYSQADITDILRRCWCGVFFECIDGNRRLHSKLSFCFVRKRIGNTNPHLL